MDPAVRMGLSEVKRNLRSLRYLKPDETSVTDGQTRCNPGTELVAHQAKRHHLQSTERQQLGQEFAQVLFFHHIPKLQFPQSPLCGTIVPRS
jgi:hypothetical protein